MLNTNIKATRVELTRDITNYLNKKLSSLEKFVTKTDTGASVQVEIGKETKHHKTGSIFFTEINFRIGGKDFCARANASTLMASMDKVKDVALDILRQDKDKKTKKHVK